MVQLQMMQVRKTYICPAQYKQHFQVDLMNSTYRFQQKENMIDLGVDFLFILGTYINKKK